jgi:5'-3' exonuclease
MREYLDLEFHDIEPVLPFDYSLERIIDDFILLAVFVGNDFLPHLPDLHIHENGLERLFEVYKKVLPSLGSSAQLARSYSCLQMLMSMICRRVHERGGKDSIEPVAGGSG